MNARGTKVRRVFAGLAAAALTSGIAITIASPAQADGFPVYGFAQSTSASYTDAASPTKAFGSTGGPYWIGSWQDSDGVSHESKAYFTFDLSTYKGAQIEAASFIVSENSVNNCDVNRQIALWQTDTPASKITWNNAPAESKKIFSGKDTAPYGCPSTYYGFDAKALITKDLTGTGIVTVEVSVPAAFATDPDYGRSLSSLGLQFTYDRAPDAPSNITINGVACGSKQILINSLAPVVHANLTDPDQANGSGNGNGPMSATIEVWPSADPSLVQTYTDGSTYAPAYLWGYIPAGTLVDGGTYVMKMQASDGILAGKWSAPCRFGVDTTGPANPPTVTSTDYPEGLDGPPNGGTNVPGTFTFSADGDKSVIGFYYGEYSDMNYVAANKPGGTATVTIIPEHPSYYDLVVAGTDKAGNNSPTKQYYFEVKDNSPIITDANPDAKFRVAHTLTFTPRQAGTISYYLYNFNNEGQQIVYANPDGTAQVQLTPDEIDEQNTVLVTSVNTDYYQSGESQYAMFIQTAPTVSSVQYPEGPFSGGIGVKGTFTFAPAYAGIVSYTYSFDNTTAQTVAANANGKATVHWTPTTSGSHNLYVTSTDNTGLVSDQTYYGFAVNSNQPAITSDVYQNYQQSGGLGVPGVFTFTAHQTGATSFVYQFGTAAAQTVPVGADGTASANFTPTAGGFTQLLVYTKNAAGTQSDPTTFWINVDPQAPTLTYTVGDDGVYTFTATSVLPGSTSFVWSVNSGDAQTIPVGPDGTATFTLTPDSGNVYDVEVYSTAGDLTSGTASSYFYVP